MTLKKINPEGLVVGKECYVKMKVVELDGSDVPICLEDNTGNGTWFHKDQPIYTHESSTDTELEMLVNVASRIYSSKNYNGFIERSVNDAKDIITACKNALKEGEI